MASGATPPSFKGFFMEEIKLRRKPTHVYLLSSEGYGHLGFFKVGVTCDFPLRFQQIQQYLPFQLSIIALAEDDDPFRLERLFLERFKEHRIKGEWFFIRPLSGIDGSTCSYREFAKGVSSSSKIVAKEMSDYLADQSTGGISHALL